MYFNMFGSNDNIFMWYKKEKKNNMFIAFSQTDTGNIPLKDTVCVL